jgi:hypothetical protein
LSVIKDWLQADEQVPSIRDLLQQFRADRGIGLVPEFRYHPLGFAYARLAAQDGLAIRLHVWSDVARAQEPIWDIHDHVFGFSSLVLLGSTRNECFEFRLDPKGDVGEFGVEYDEQGSILTSLGNVGRIYETEATVVRAGGLYTMPPGKLHRTTPCNTLVATVLRTVQTDVGRVRVIGSTQHPFNVAYKREALDQATSSALFGRLISELEARLL